MKTISFNPLGDRLTISFTFEGLIVASYSFSLWEAESNNRIMYETGNNQNTDDDVYKLPLPVENNDGRLIQLRTEFTGLDPVNNELYKIKAKIFQDSFIEEIEDSGEITGKAQSSLIYILLKSKQ